MMSVKVIVEFLSTPRSADTAQQSVCGKYV